MRFNLPLKFKKIRKKKENDSLPSCLVVVLVLLILLNSIATMECTFLIMNILKIRFCNKIRDDILKDSLILQIKRKIVAILSK